MAKRNNRFNHDRSFGRRNQGKSAPKNVLIVTEGTVTEPAYFQALAQSWNLHPKVIHLEAGGEGIPENLAQLAIRERDTRIKAHKKNRLAYNETTFDEVWIVFDTEHAARQGKLHDGVTFAEKNKILIAHSTPCFEFWLSLHFSDQAPPMNTCDEAEKLFKKVAGLKKYSKDKTTALSVTQLSVPRVAEAVKNATNLSQRQDGVDFPANPSCSVQDLIYSLYEACPIEFKNRIALPPKI